MRTSIHLFIFLSFIFKPFFIQAQISTCFAPVAGEVNCFQTSRPNNGNSLLNWPPIPHQDCCNAIGIVDPFTSISNGVLIPQGTLPSGTIFPGCVRDELPADANTCFSNNEKATTWYKFQVKPLPGGPTANGAPAGKLRFKIIPQDVIGLANYDPATDQGSLSYGNTDYDFLLFDVSETYYGQFGACATIKGSPAYNLPNSVIKRCNWIGTRGPTGLFEPGIGLDAAAGQAGRFNKPLPVKVGQIFYLAVDNFSINQQGFFLDFRGIEAPDDSTAQLFSPDGDLSGLKLITGSIFKNLNNNCSKESNELGFVNRIVKAEPGPYYGVSGRNGKFSIYVDSGNYVVNQIFNPITSLIESQFCPPNNGGFQANFVGPDTISNANFANTAQDCYFLKVNVAAGLRRRCVRGKTEINVCNLGYSNSINTVVKAKFPSSLKIISSSVPFVFNGFDSTYSFQIGSVPGGNSCKKIEIIDSVACINGITGQNLCVRTWIGVNQNCTFFPLNWDGVDLKVSSVCNANSPTFKIKNNGLAMNHTRNYNVYAGANLAYTGSIQLGANDSTVLQVNSSQPFIRLEVNQSANHPFASFSAAHTPCNYTGTAASFFTHEEESPSESRTCGIIVDSYDPNDKQVQPQGFTTQGLIPPNRPFEYKIRFQNTGNAEAFRVTIIDTLDEDLDISSFEEIASSHNYVLSVVGRGKPVLKFTFHNILLPDSASDPIGSQGFVSFKIKHQDGLPLGTQIKNFADIYFDFNDPIRTNTTVNTLYVPALVSDLVDTVVILSNWEKVSLKPEFSIYPNPNTGKFNIQSNETSNVRVFTITGKEILKFEMEPSRKFIDLQSFDKGIYLLESSNSKGKIVRKLVKE